MTASQEATPEAPAGEPNAKGASPAGGKRAAEPAAHRDGVPVASMIGALFIVALALRPQISAIGPLVPGIIAELGASHAYVGLLTAVPVLCMGVFALVGPSIAAWFGSRTGIALSVAIIVASGILRAFAPDAGLLLLATLAIGVGTATIGPILPMFVRDRMPTRNVGGTSSYAAGTIVGAALGAALAVPLATALGGWRDALLALSVLSAGCILAWLWMVRPRRGPEATDAMPASGPRRVRRLELPRLPLRRPVAWAIGILFALQSWLFYGQTAWLSSIYVEHGWAPGSAAGLLSVVNLASLLAIGLVPAGARRGLSRRALLTTASSLSLGGLLGISLVPDGAVPWAMLLGAGLGMMFTLLLTLPTDMSGDPREVGGTAAMMFLVGYGLASFAPTVLGAARDATGNFGASVWLLVLLAVAMVPLSWSLSPRRLRPSREAVPVPA